VQIKQTTWDEITVVDKQLDVLLTKKKYLLITWFHEKLNFLLEQVQANHIELVMHDYPNQSGGKGLTMRLDEDNPNHIFKQINNFQDYYWYFKEYQINYNQEIDLIIKMDLAKKMISNQGYVFTKDISLDNFFENFASQEINSYHLSNKLEANLSESKTHKVIKI
jgi:hypothetical protein